MPSAQLINIEHLEEKSILTIQAAYEKLARTGELNGLTTAEAIVCCIWRLDGYTRVFLGWVERSTALVIGLCTMFIHTYTYNEMIFIYIYIYTIYVYDLCISITYIYIYISHITYIYIYIYIYTQIYQMSLRLMWEFLGVASPGFICITGR